MTPGFWTLPEFFTERFPAMRAGIEEESVSWYGERADPYAHRYLVRFLLPELLDAAGSGDAARIAVAYDTFDELLQSTDEDLAGATLFTIIDTIANDPAMVETTLPHMRPIARERTTQLLEQQKRRKRSRPGRESRRRRTSATARTRLLRLFVARRDWRRRLAINPFDHP
jgi:hypothetical protein